MHLSELLTRREPSPEALMGIYLNDHRAGAEGAGALARRCAKSNAGNEVGRYLTETFLPELALDRARLEEVRAQTGVGDDPVKQLGARVGEFVGRAKPNGALRSYSPLSRVLELEMLIAGVTDKRRLWATLSTVSGGGDHRDEIARAEDQIDRLSELHLWAIGEAFPS